MRRAALCAAAAAALLAGSPALAAKRPLGPGERIDLNRASVTELMRLPGIGEKRAQAIVAQRARQPFRRPEDVLKVKGIGPAWLAKVKGSVTVGGVPPEGPSARRRGAGAATSPKPRANPAGARALRPGPRAPARRAPLTPASRGRYSWRRFSGSEEQGSRSKSGAVPPL